jgi:hypothetical protein
MDDPPRIRHEQVKGRLAPCNPRNASRSAARRKFRASVSDGAAATDALKSDSFLIWNRSDAAKSTSTRLLML